MKEITLVLQITHDDGYTDEQVLYQVSKALEDAGIMSWVEIGGKHGNPEKGNADSNH